MPRTTTTRTGAPAHGTAQVHRDQDLLQVPGEVEATDFPLTAFVWE